jgi:hypothetical protein
MLAGGSLKEIAVGIFALTTTVEYSEETGLLADELPCNPENFMV